MNLSLSKIRNMSKRIKAMSDEAIEEYAETQNKNLKQAGFSLFKSAMMLDLYAEDLEKNKPEEINTQDELDNPAHYPETDNVE